MTARVYRHVVPRLDGCPLEDSQCSGCQFALEPSLSFFIINLCEKDLGCQSGCGADLDNLIAMGGARSSSTYSLDQVSYCIESCEEAFKVHCNNCQTSVSRTDFRDHICSSNSAQ